MKKFGRILLFFIGVILLLSLLASCGTAGSGETDQSTESNTGNVTTEPEIDATTAEVTEPDPPTPKITNIYTAEQLLLVADMINEEGTGEMTEGVIYRLAADIDLNEGWSAEVTASGDEVSNVPQAPANAWAGIKKFRGTLDGNGKKITGVYMSKTLESNATMGFIVELDGGTVRNLTIENSFISANVGETAENVYVGGLVGSVGSASVIENVTVNADLFVRGNENAVAAGIAAKKAENALTETNVVFGGTVYRASVADKQKSISAFNESDPEGTVYTISSAEELQTFATSVGGSTNKGRGFVFKLTADIDLNPDWNAKPTINTNDKTVVFPSAPDNSWACFNFAGTFDGQGHSIAGLYRDVEFGEWGDNGLFFKHLLDNATVRNLVLVNGFFFGHQPGNAKSNRIIGGLASYANGNNITIENVYVDVNLWDTGYNAVKMGGVIGRINDNKTGLTLRSTVFAGTIGSVSTREATNYPSSSTGAQIGQLIGDANGRPSACVNVVLCGSIYTASGTWDNIAKNNGNGSKVQTNIVIGKYESVDEANSDWGITNYDKNTIDMAYSNVAGTIVPTRIAEFLSVE